MMMSKQKIWQLLNPVYFLAIAGIWFIYKSLSELKTTPLSFHGFAENAETEINLDYDVEVTKVLVVPGQAVKQGEVLLEVKNIKLAQDIINNNQEINILRAEKKAWVEEEQGKLKTLELNKESDLAGLKQDIEQYKTEINYLKQLWQGLKTIPDSLNLSFLNLDKKISEKELEIIQKTNYYDTQINVLKQSIKYGQNPYLQQEIKLSSANDYTGQRIQKLKILAPHDGLIGNVHCSEGEFIDAFSPLITYYEPNPTQVKAYVLENQAFQVNLRDTFKIISVRDENLQYEGILIGLGSRIVEIPERMRKIPEIKSYGREVVIQVPSDNRLIQKEKVRLQPVHLRMIQ